MASAIPNEVKENLSLLNNQITELEKVVDLFIVNRPQYETLSLLEKARIELASLFSINSLYWVLLRCKGLDPNEDADLSAELKRIKEYMGKLKNFEDADKRPKYENKTVGRFVKHALFELNSSSDCVNTTSEQTECESSSTRFSHEIDDEIVLDDDVVDLSSVVGDELPAKKHKRT
ncbi:hypothetical protein niasHS_012180 [Heterodera schachtii]|uniref:Nuclear nucleic acid-binding protein C1D n=1 Tax=Heterodera schachtii TaxID=97005 RepID=A0ABD2IAW1_HETSC